MLSAALHLWRSMMACDYLLPDDNTQLVAYRDPLPSCVLEEGHTGDHLIRTSNGRYAVFMPYTEPCGEDCECAADMETIGYECYTYGFVTKEEAERMIAESKAKPPDD